MTRTTLPTLAALASSLVLSVALPAFSQDAPQVRVSYADLDLAHAPGRAQFLRRIDAAIRQVCGEADNADLVAMAEQRNCRNAAHVGVRAQIRTAIAAAARPTQLAER